MRFPVRYLRVLGSGLAWSVTILAWVMGALIVGLFVGFVWLTATASGAHWLMGQANQRVDGLAITASAGNLWQGLTLSDLRYRLPDGVRVAAGRVQIQLDWRQFWHKNLQIKTLSAQDVSIQLPADSSPSSPSAPLDLNHLPLKLPVGLDVAALSLQRVTLIHPEGRVDRLDDLQASVQATQQTITLHLQRSLWSLPPGEQVSLRGRLSIATASPHRLTGGLQLGVDLPQGWLETSVDLAGRLAEVQSHWVAQWTGFSSPDAHLQATARITPQRLVLDHVAVDALGGTFCARGQVDYGAADLHAEVTGQAKALDPAAFAPRLAGRMGFDLHARLNQPLGTSIPSIQLTMTHVGGALAQMPIHDLTATLKLVDQGLEVTVDGGAIAGGSLTLDAQLGLQNNRPMTLALTTKNLDLAPFVGGLPSGASSRLSGQAQVSGKLGADPLRDAQLAVVLDPVRMAVSLPATAQSPAIQEQLTGRLHAAVQGQTVRIDQSQWRWGQAELTAHGQMDWGKRDAPLTLTAKLAVPDLARLPWAVMHLPSATGAIQGALTLTGSLRQPQSKFSVQGHHLSMAGWQLAALNAQGRMDPGSGSVASSPVHVRVTADRLIQSSDASSVKTWLNQLKLGVDGSWAQQDITLDAMAPEGRLALAAQGGFRDQGWEGMLRRLDLSALPKRRSAGEARDGEHWRLQAPARVMVDAAAQQLGKTCLGQGNDYLCVTGTHRALTSAATLSGDVALNVLAPWLPAGVQLPGRIKLDANAAVHAGQTSAQVHVVLPDNRFSAAELAAGKWFSYRQVRVNAEIKQNQATLDYRAEIPQLLSVVGGGSVALTGHQVMNLTTQIKMADLGALAFALPQVTRLQGQGEADVRVTGPLMHPRPSGTLRVQNLAFVLPDTGVGYRDGQLNGQIDTQGQLKFSGQLTGVDATPVPAADKKPSEPVPLATSSIKPRHLQVTGTGDLAHLPDWQIQADIKGQAVPVLRIPTLVVDASPNLTVKADQTGATLGGSVVLPLVTARIEKLPDTVVRSTSDLVIVGARAAPKVASYPVKGDIALTLGNQVTLAGMGFSTGITGSLDLRLRPDKPIAAYGEINLKNGVYKAYGQDLAIQSGQLIFVGPLTDPGLAVSAARTIDTSVVGLKIGGTLHDPKTTVFSQPSMPESDALSLLLTGRRLNDSSSADASTLLNAIAGLGVSQGDDIAREIGQKFGLDSVGLDTTGGIAGTRLTLGKRIGDNLLVRYAVGVTTGIGEVITHYKLNRLFALEVTASPAATGGDLIYRIH